MSARAAVTVAEQYAQMLLDKEHIVRKTFGPALSPVFDTIREAHVQAALTGSRDGLNHTEYVAATALAASRVGERGYAEIRFTAQEAAQRRLWQQHRIVYDIDPHLWAELGDTETDTVIPADLFSRLPHPDPFVSLPEPLVLPIDADTRQVIQGFFVRGHADVADAPGERIQTSTHHPAASNLGATFGGLIETTTGQPVFVPGVPGTLRDVVWTRVTLDPRVGQHTVAEMINATVQRFSGYKEGNWEEDVPRMIRRAVSLLVYLCATNADLTSLPRRSSVGTRGKGREGSRKPKPSQVVGVGYRVGAALAAYRQQERDDVAAAVVHTGGKKAPHIRRAHFHTYRVGPGRRESEVKWLAPIPINLHGEAGQSTVIPVHRPRSA